MYANLEKLENTVNEVQYTVSKILEREGKKQEKKAYAQKLVIQEHAKDELQRKVNVLQQKSTAATTLLQNGMKNVIEIVQHTQYQR